MNFFMINRRGDPTNERKTSAAYLVNSVGEYVSLIARRFVDFVTIAKEQELY